MLGVEWIFEAAKVFCYECLTLTKAGRNTGEPCNGVHVDDYTRDQPPVQDLF